MRWTIYKLTSLSTGKSYIGQTRRPTQRHQAHLRLFPDRFAGGHVWQELAMALDQDAACFAEAWCIMSHGTLDPDGYNLRSGGMKGFHHEDATREKMAASKVDLWSRKPHPWKGRKKTAEHIAKISAAQRGRPSGRKGVPMPEKQRLALSAARKGKPPGNAGMPRSEAARARIRAGIRDAHERRAAAAAAAIAAGLPAPPNNYRKPKRKRGPLSEEVKAKIRAGNLGRKHTEETLMKLRQKRGPQKTKRSAEHSRKIGDAHRGMKRSPEARARIAAGIRAAHARRAALTDAAKTPACEPLLEPPF